MEVRRTVPVKLDVDSDDAALFRETVDEFLWAANYVVDHAWQGDYKTTSKAQLQEETYDDVRDQTRLHANGGYEPPAGDSGQSGSPRESPSAGSQSARRQTKSDGTLNEANGDSAERSSADHSSGPSAREKKP
jgi:hypothetical protein